MTQEKSTMEMNATQPKIEERLAWHKPEVQQLVVNLDTGIGPGSSGDFDAQDPGKLST
jgi:hypothetical protein